MPFSGRPYLMIVDIVGIAKKLFLFKIGLLLFTNCKLDKSYSTFTLSRHNFSSRKYSLIYITSFLSFYAGIKGIILSLQFNIQFINFSLFYFFNFKLFFICFLQLFFVKLSNNFLTIKITKSKCPQHIVFNIFNQRTVLRPTLNITFLKNICIF